MISQGSIQEHTFEFERSGTTTAVVSFRVTAPMVPRVKVLGVFSRDDGELVADLIEIPVECTLQNQVRRHYCKLISNVREIHFGVLNNIMTLPSNF